MHLYLSTSVKSEQFTDGEQLAAAFTPFAVSGLELNYRIWPEALAGLRPGLSAAGFSVCSTHNFFPVPDVRPRRPGGGDFFNLASLDPDEHREAIKWSVRTMEHTADFGADAVVLHCGRVEMDHRIERLRDLFLENRLDTPEGRQFINGRTAELARKKPAHFDKLKFSLDKLLGAADRLNVRLGIETRNHYHELPDPADFEILFAEFDGGPIGYWHDTGHAYVNEILCFYNAAALMERFGSRLIGVHIHDAVDFTDHLPPGQGEIDFGYLLPYLTDDVISVFEINPPTPDEQVMAGIDWFREFLESSGKP